MYPHYTVRFDPYKVLEHFGGISGAVTALELVGMTVEPKMLQKQRERGSMSADMIASLALASVKAGRPLNLYDCLIAKVNKGSKEWESSGSNIPHGMTKRVRPAPKGLKQRK